MDGRLMGLSKQRSCWQSEFYSPQGPCTVPQADGSSHTRGPSFPSSQEHGLWTCMQILTLPPLAHVLGQPTSL